MTLLLHRIMKSGMTEACSDDLNLRTISLSDCCSGWRDEGNRSEIGKCRQSDEIISSTCIEERTWNDESMNHNRSSNIK